MPINRLFDPKPRHEWRRVFPLLLLIALVWVVELGSNGIGLHFPMLRYLVAHTAFEVAAVVLAAISFGLLWMAPDSAHRSGTVVLAATMAVAAGLDFLHMLSYAGMPPLVTPSSVEKGIAFCLSARFLITAGLLAMAFLPAQRLISGRQRYAVLVAALGVGLLLTWAILFQPESLPRTYIEGQGLTAAKVGAEIVLIVLLLIAGLRLELRARAAADAAMAAMAIAAVLAAAAELFFTYYSHAADLFNGLGHMVKIAALWYLMRSAYLMSVRQPLEAAGGVADALVATINPALICSNQGKIRWMNRAFGQATGYAPLALLGKGIEALQVAGDEAAWQEMHKAMREGLAWQGQMRVLRSNGSIYLDDRSLTPMRNAQGHLIGFVILGDDVTERTRIARELQSSEERLRALLQSAPDAVVVIDRQGRIQLINAAVEQMFGYGAAELVGTDVAVLMPSDVGAQHGGFLQSYLHTGERRIIGRGRDMVARSKDGRLLNVHLTIGEAHLADGLVFIGFMRDITDRILARNALAESEARYRAMIDTAVDGVWISDSAGRFLIVNDAYVKMSGYSREELLRMQIADIEANHNAQGVAALLVKIVEQGYQKFETRHRDKSGRIWPVEITITYWATGGGQFFAFARDLSERHAAAEALRQSEARFEMALHASNDGIWDMNLLDGTVYLSPRWKEILGYREDELTDIRAAIELLLHPADAVAVRRAIADILAGRSPERYQLEFRLRHKQGHWVDVLTRGQTVRDASGRLVRLIGTQQDLSERKRAEQAVRESEDKLRNLFDLSPLGIVLSTMDGKLVQFNEAYRVLTGYTAEALLRMSYWDFTPTEYMSAEGERWKSVAQTGRYGPYEKEYLRVDGTRIPVRLNGVRIEQGGKEFLWSIVEDLTLSRRVEAERQAMQQQQMQSQKLEALGHLTGGVAHDFNNMLTGIMGLASLGLERYVVEPEGKLAQYLREIVRTSERGRDLVAKMLTYVRTEEPENVAPRHLGPLVGQMSDMLKSSIPSGIALNFQSEEDLPPVRISAVDVHQIVMNLVINARDAIGEHGHIAIRMSGAQLRNEACSNCHEHASGSFLVLEVEDDGSGVPPAVLHKIFDPFFTTKEVGKGTGLGLASVIGLVHKSGGHVQVRNVTPHGILMRVMLPAAQVEPEQEPPEAQPTHFDAGEPLWVVDDDPAVLVFLSELLREKGFSVSSFSDPREVLAALQLALRQPGRTVLPAVLITDQTMPGMSGADLVKACLAIHPALNVILCTGYAERIDANSALAMGVKHFLRKPFNSRELLAALADLLERK